MNPTIVFIVIAGYFLLLITISYFTGKKTNNASFFTANKNSPWFLVAFGMIGASLSGVTFISVPGEVIDKHFFYFQMVLGYLLGYFVIATILLPLYYKLNLVTIYSYLERRFGYYAYKTGSAFFIISRIIGSSFRLFLVAGVLQIGFFDAFNIPFEVTVAVTIGLIWVYTYKAGIKTIVWTDTLQTFFMLAAVITTIIIIGNNLNLSVSEIYTTIRDYSNSTIFDWNWHSDTFFVKQFLGGAFIAIVMTGLDQDMMQKNLTCKNTKESQKNMFWFSITLVPVNLIFLSLGALLYIYAAKNSINLPQRTDELYPLLALNHLSTFTGIVFLLGITAAAFSSADSALTALTTSFSVDFMNIKVNDESKKTKKKRTYIHMVFSLLLFLTIIIFNKFNDKSVISSVFKAAGYTYGPILGLFAFGIFTKLKTNDIVIPFIAIISPIITFLINTYSEQLLYGYKFGFEILILNGLITFLGLLAFSKKAVIE